MAWLASGNQCARRGGHALKRSAVCLVSVAITACVLAPAAAADHDTVGGGTFSVYNSDSPCTEFVADHAPQILCNGGWINLAGISDYIVVPLGNHISVGCNTYAPDGSLYEHEVENLIEVPEKQRFWAERGWQPYEPQAICQLW